MRTSAPAKGHRGACTKTERAAPVLVIWNDRGPTD